jgi:hypothetical protein
MRRGASSVIVIIIGSIICAALVFAQQLQVIGNDSVAGPICAGPLGPGPCAAVQQYILNQQQGQPGPRRVLPIPGVPGAGSPPLMAGAHSRLQLTARSRRAGTWACSPPAPARTLSCLEINRPFWIARSRIRLRKNLPAARLLTWVFSSATISAFSLIAR